MQIVVNCVILQIVSALVCFLRYCNIGDKVLT